MRHVLQRLSICAALLCTAARADLHVVVNAASPLKALTTKEAVDLYMGRTRTLACGD